jgi:hypothetical protein
VAFKTSLTAANILGGVKKNEGDHGFKKNPDLFNQNTDFSIIFITVDQYNQNKDNLAALTQKPFTRLFATYNATGTNEVPWIVSGRLGGNNRLVIHNMTTWNMELRQDSPRGTTLGYAPYQALNTTLSMNDGSFYAFPVFKSYNAVRDEILTIYPKNLSDQLPISASFSFYGGNEITINAATYTGASAFTSGAAYLLIKNDSDDGITVMHGTDLKKTESGIYVINAGDQRTFPILMPGENGSYAADDSFSGWKIVNMGVREVNIPLITTDGGKICSDYRYTVTVSGTWYGNGNWPANINVSAPIKGGLVTTEFVNP